MKQWPSLFHLRRKTVYHVSKPHVSGFNGGRGRSIKILFL